MKNWALKFELNHEKANVKTIYYTAAYFELDGLTNPATGEAYTDGDVARIREKAGEGNDNYVFDSRENALIGMQAYDTGKMFWYDEENSKKIISYAAPLILDGNSGEMKTAEGNTAAIAY